LQLDPATGSLRNEADAGGLWEREYADGWRKALVA
jgi:hypothetical protein